MLFKLKEALYTVNIFIYAANIFIQLYVFQYYNTFTVKNKIKTVF